MTIYICPEELMVRESTETYNNEPWPDDQAMIDEDAFFDALERREQAKAARQKQNFAARCQYTPPVLTVARSAL